MKKQIRTLKRKLRALRQRYQDFNFIYWLYLADIDGQILPTESKPLKADQKNGNY